MDNTYLCHHGVKGQKWGVRRYQKADGTLTNEGRRAYGYGRGADSIIRKNTAKRAIGGAKKGAAIGGIAGVISTAVSATMYATMAASFGPAFATAWLGSIATAAIIGGTGKGALTGLTIGGIAGAVETKKGREYIERYDTGLSEFERQERSSKYD